MRLTVLTFFLVLALTACGIKPRAVDAPPGTEQDTFPKTYPDSAADPHP
jgi:hypothetical protein